MPSSVVISCGTFPISQSASLFRRLDLIRCSGRGMTWLLVSVRAAGASLVRLRPAVGARSSV